MADNPPDVSLLLPVFSSLRPPSLSLPLLREKQPAWLTDRRAAIENLNRQFAKPWFPALHLGNDLGGDISRVRVWSASREVLDEYAGSFVPATTTVAWVRSE